MFKKYFLRIVAGLAILILITLIAVGVTAVIYKQEIKHRIMLEVNSRLKNPMRIEHISVSVIDNFPGVTFSLHNVFVPKADTLSALPLIQFGKLDIVFNAYKIIIGNYTISKVELNDGFINAKVDSNGVRDFEIWYKNSDTINTNTAPPKEIVLDIEKVVFSNVEISYENKYKPKKLRMILKSAKSSLHISPTELTGDLTGFIYSHEFTLKPGTLFREANLHPDFHFKFDIPNKVFSFKDCILKVKDDVFVSNGSIDFKKESMMHLEILTEHADIEHVFALLPHKWYQKMDSIDMKGNISAKANIILSLLPGMQPNITIEFHTDNFKVQKHGMKTIVHDLHFKGNLTSTDSLTMEYYQLNLTNLHGKIDSSSTISSNSIRIHNFIRPTLITDVILDLQSKELFRLVKFEKYDQVSGSVHVDLKYNGYLNYLAGKEAEAPDLRGSIQLQKVGLKLQALTFPFTNINGKIDFSNDTIHVNQFKISCGKTDLNVNGTAYHLFKSVFRDTTGLKMKMDFTSDNFYYADFNIGPKKKTNKPKFRKEAVKLKGNHIVLPFDVAADFTGKIKNFYSRNYKGEDISFSAHIASDKITISESMQTFGGEMKVSNRIVANNSSGLNYHTNIALKNVQVKKVFKAFSDFGQKFITSDKINGTLNGVFNIYFRTDKTLKIDTSTINVKGDYTINNMELDQVEPLMKLSKIGFDEKDLVAISCKEIKSSLSIDGNRVHIPRTLLVTNILFLYLEVNLQIGGEVDILALIPVKNIKKQPKTEDLTNDSQVGMAIPLRITGKAGNLKPQLIKIKK